MTSLLLPTTSAIKTRPYAVIDIESKDGETQRAGFTRPFLAGWYEPKTGFFETRGPACIELMIAFACRDQYDGYSFYAHFGGSFDWLHFLPFIHSRGFHYEIMTVGSTIQLLHVKPHKDSHKKGWTFLDSSKIVPMSLEKAARSFGVQLKKHIDLDLHESSPEWTERVQGDCLTTYEVVRRYHELIEIRLQGEVGITAASTAMRTFRRGFMKAPIHRHEEHRPLFRDCYYGGRVERFATKVSGIRVYDINSSYPWAMTQPMPVGPCQEWSGEPSTLFRTRAEQGSAIGFVRARVRVPEDTYIPVLPYRSGLVGEKKDGAPKDKKLLFPAGTFDGAWDYAELERAERMGAEVLEWRESVWVEAGLPFSTMVSCLYSYRDKSRPDYDEGLATVAKILLNSLYGKFGMKEDRERLVRVNLEEEELPEGARAANAKDENCELWYIPQVADADYVCPQIAAHVTTLSRLKLHDYFTLAHERGVLAYGDTDSIHTTADLSDYVGSGLGGLKDEGEGERYEGEYLQPKLYILEGDRGTVKLTMKGYQPPKAVGKRDYYDRVRRGETVTFQGLEKIGAMAARSFSSPPRMRSISRSIKSEDGKRVMVSATRSRAIKVG